MAHVLKSVEHSLNLNVCSSRTNEKTVEMEFFPFISEHLVKLQFSERMESNFVFSSFTNNLQKLI